MKYDDAFMLIFHYRVHPEMLPFVGRHYREARILLVGESHFFEGLTENEIKYANESWYTLPLPEDYNLAHRENYDTRGVVNRYLTLRRTKAHSMFRNPANGIIEALQLDNVNDSEAFTACAFMNYFQRPALESHESIEPEDRDIEVAFSTFIQVKEILDPCVVVFLSQKADKAYESSLQKSGCDADQRVIFTAHPTCSYWNGDNGLAKFEEVIVNSILFRNFDQDTALHTSELPGLPIPFKLLQKGQNRFIEDTITVKYYTASSDNHITEIVWHTQLHGIRYGLGYVLKQKIMWLWNYNEKKYVEESTWKADKRLNDLYEKAIQFICDI